MQYRYVLLVFIALLLPFSPGCGGGGGGNSLVSPTTSVPQPTPGTTQPSEIPSPSPAPVLSPTPTPGISGPPITIPVGDVEISGEITYDYVPHKSNGGLDYSAIEQRPVRGVVIQLVDERASVVGETLTNTKGQYSFNVERDTAYKVRVKAELQQDTAPTWSIKVTNNTNNNVQYVAEGELASSNNGEQRNIHLASGWTGADYSEPRSAAPFAILDSVYQLLAVMVDEGFTTNLPAMEIRWSVNNRANFGELENGDIGSSLYDPNNTAVYILGEKNNDTDEYDRSVVQHEFAHYLEDALSRSDSIGGAHDSGDKLDMRVAFSEGLANAITGFASGTGMYEDAGGFLQGSGFRFSIEDDEDVHSIGWYSETSVGSLVLDLVDDTSEAGDSIDLGLTPILHTLAREQYKSSPLLTSVFLFLEQLKLSQVTELGSEIDRLARSYNINSSNALASGETNDGGVDIALPIYHSTALGVPVQVCSGGSESLYYNAVNVRRFVRFSLGQSRQYRITINKAALTPGTKNPDGVLFFEGRRIALLESKTNNTEISTRTLNAGNYVLEVYDFNNAEEQPAGALACFDVSITEA